MPVMYELYGFQQITEYLHIEHLRFADYIKLLTDRDLHASVPYTLCCQLLYIVLACAQ